MAVGNELSLYQCDDENSTLETVTKMIDGM